MGSTLYCDASEDDLASVARKWYRQFVRAAQILNYVGPVF